VFGLEVSGLAPSKPYLSGELKISGITRAGDGSEGGAAKGAVRIVQRGSVADVEDFRAEFKINPLRYPKRFADHQVGILETGPPHRIPRAVADAELSGGGEGRFVKPCGSAASGEGVGVTNAIRPLHGVAECRQSIRRLRDRYRVSRLDARQAADLPPGDLPPSRNLVHPTSGKDPWDVTARNISFEFPIECIGGPDRGERGSGENGLRKICRGVVNELGERVGEGEGQATRKAFFQLHLQRLVFGIGNIVAEKGYIREARKGAQQLLLRDGLLS
jgi:hypothetical protein